MMIDLYYLLHILYYTVHTEKSDKFGLEYLIQRKEKKQIFLGAVWINVPAL